jgi:Tol biopolymer transport system component
MNIWKILARGGSPVQITSGRVDEMALDLSPDGQKTIFDSQRSATNLLEVQVGSSAGSGRRWLTTDASRGTFAPVYSPDGRRMAPIPSSLSKTAT